MRSELKLLGGMLLHASGCAIMGWGLVTPPYALFVLPIYVIALFTAGSIVRAHGGHLASACISAVSFAMVTLILLVHLGDSSLRFLLALGFASVSMAHFRLIHRLMRF